VCVLIYAETQQKCNYFYANTKPDLLAPEPHNFPQDFPRISPDRLCPSPICSRLLYLLLGSKDKPNLGSEPAKNFMARHDTAGTPATRGACPNMAPLLIYCWYASTGSSVVNGLSGRSFFIDAAFPDTESPCSRESAVDVHHWSRSPCRRGSPCSRESAVNVHHWSRSPCRRG
jgi:hypothetical protein